MLPVWRCQRLASYAWTAFTPGEIEALLRACDDTNAGKRDAALIALAYVTGMRRDELAGLTMDDLQPNNDDGADVVVRGKGDKVRTVYVDNGAFSRLLAWLQMRGDAPGALFVRINKSDVIDGGELSGEALRLILNKRQEQAKLSKPITWHDFRRTFAGELWGAGIDGVTIQKLMGHASQDLTARYDRRPEDARRQAVKVLHVPYA